MSQPIYVLVVAKGHTEAWHQLSKEAQDDLWAKVVESGKPYNVHWVILCKSRWADEEIFDWGVLEYPDFESYLKRVNALEELNWWRYFDAHTILGTKWEIEE